jgi:hypothetical protein
MVSYPPVEGNETLNNLAEKPGYKFNSGVFYFADVDVSIDARFFY